MAARLRISCLLLAALALLSAPSAAGAAPPIKHVFVLVLENENAATSFGPAAPSPYLARTLPAMGAFVPNYYGIGHASLDNYVAMVSGQGPNAITQADCPLFMDVVPGVVGPDGQTVGLGCVYPRQVLTIGDQLDAHGLSWRGYMQSMGADPSRESATCGHPALGTADRTESATAKDQYATRHNPFMYFHSVIDNRARCDQHVVNLDRLPADLASAQTTPAYSFISPDLCGDGHDSTCADASRPGGFKGIDGFLSTWVPRIVTSPAFRDGGLLAVIFDEAGTGDSSSCCHEPTGPGTPNNGAFTPGSGGGRTGAVLVSPYIRAGTVTQTAYNHYSLLRSVEDLFGLGHLGYAAASGLTTLGPDVFTAPARHALPTAPVGCVASKITARRGRLPRGSVLRSVQVLVRAGRARLRLDIAHGATVSVRIGTHRARTLRVRACRRYDVSLGRGHGRVVLRARVGAATETRSLRY